MSVTGEVDDSMVMEDSEVNSGEGEDVEKNQLIKFVELYETLPDLWDSQTGDFKHNVKPKIALLDKLTNFCNEMKPNVPSTGVISDRRSNLG